MASAPSTPPPPRRSRDSSDNLTPKPRPRISIIDHTATVEDSEQSSRPQTPIEDGDSTARASRTRSGTLREQKAKWKYGKYTEERAEGRPLSGKGAESNGEQTTSAHDLTLTESEWGQSALERRKRRIQNKVLGRKRASTIQDGITEIDVLYENQRGAFFCGIPFFSPKALNPMDPSPWVDGEYKKSRENITDAQVPDPSWEWTWRTWYVDMSRDVDEEGWEYSFFFKGFSWHGTHPWFHSFVRRRRWIRKRSRRRSDRDTSDPHGLTKDYFTIHTGRIKSITSRATTPTSERPISKKWTAEEKEGWGNEEIADIGTLIHALKVAPVDSERISLIKQFIEQGGDDLYYLADEMPNIMSYFFHEHSSSRLLALLREKIQSADIHLKEHQDSGELQDPVEKRYTEALLKAAKAVDEQCKQLQFWSDSRGLPKVSRVSFEMDNPSSSTQSQDKFMDAVEMSPEAIEDNHDEDHSVGSSKDSIRMTKEDKGKAPIRHVEGVNIGGFDGTFDVTSPQPMTTSIPPITVSRASTDEIFDPQKVEHRVTRSRASHGSLRRQSSATESVKLKELSPEPLLDQLEEQEAPTHVKSKARRHSSVKILRGKDIKSGAADSGTKDTK